MKKNTPKNRKRKSNKRIPKKISLRDEHPNFLQLSNSFTVKFRGELNEFPQTLKEHLRTALINSLNIPEQHKKRIQVIGNRKEKNDILIAKEKAGELTKNEFLRALKEQIQTLKEKPQKTEEEKQDLEWRQKKLKRFKKSDMREILTTGAIIYNKELAFLLGNQRKKFVQGMQEIFQVVELQTRKILEEIHLKTAPIGSEMLRTDGRFGEFNAIKRIIALIRFFGGIKKHGKKIFDELTTQTIEELKPKKRNTIFRIKNANKKRQELIELQRLSLETIKRLPKEHIINQIENLIQTIEGKENKNREDRKKQAHLIALKKILQGTFKEEEIQRFGLEQRILDLARLKKDDEYERIQLVTNIIKELIGFTHIYTDEIERILDPEEREYFRAQQRQNLIVWNLFGKQKL